MTFRTRLSLAATTGVAVAVVLASAAIWFIARGQLRGQVDAALRARLQAVEISEVGGAVRITFPDLPFGGAGGYAQLVDSSGLVYRQQGATVTLPHGQQVEAVAAGRRGPYFRDAYVAGVHVRILTASLQSGPFRSGFAVELARPLDEVDKTLHRLGLILLAVGISGIALATALGALIARTALAPVRRLTEATEHVASTTDLSQRMDVTGDDELSRLARSFNQMLEALDRSLAMQRQLVADASHELRTPLTSVRTNIEVLARANDLPGEERERMLQDAVGQLEELSILVRDLMELARGSEMQEEPTDVRLDAIVQGAVDRMRRYSQKVTFEVTAEPSTILGVASRIERAVTNLLDNAQKYAPPGSVVDVRVAGGELTVRDRGPGIADEDLPFVFDRFYRSTSARGLPGSGLGLAIVRQVAESHGGDVTAERAPGGGALFRLRLTSIPAPPARVTV